MREAPNRFSGEVPDTPPAFAHETRNTAAFDGTKEYCTRDIVLFWQPSSCFSQWTPSRFTVEGDSYSCGEQFFDAEKSRLFGDHQTLQHVMRVSKPRLHKQYGTEVRSFDLAVWERERENIVFVGSYAKFTPNPTMPSHLLETGDRLLAEGSPYVLIRGIGYSADHVSARQPPLWRGLNLLGKTLQTVRHLFRDRAPPPTRHQLLSRQGISPSSRECIFELDPSTRQRLCPEDTSAAASSSGYPLSLPHVPSDHGGDVLAVMSAAHSGQHSSLPAEQGPCLVAGVVTMEDSSFTTKIKIHNGPVAVQLGCVALLDTGSPQTFINTHALQSTKRAGAACAIHERHTPPTSWGAGKSPPLQSSTAVRLSVQFFEDDQPTASLAVWEYVVPAEAMQHNVLLGRDSWMRFNDRSYRTLSPRPEDNRIWG